MLRAKQRAAQEVRVRSGENHMDDHLLFAKRSRSMDMEPSRNWSSPRYPYLG